MSSIEDVQVSGPPVHPVTAISHVSQNATSWNSGEDLLF